MRVENREVHLQGGWEEVTGRIGMCTIARS